ncbi:MAG TPA: AraC family transcriptional regulator [Polyangiaceae bacterium]|nr:AraC family transcriptional regulator [Polyangiaceae bacterium]
MSTDTLSAVLRAVRLTGAVFFSVDARAPWVAEAPPGRVVGPGILPGVEHVIEYHVIAEGSCWGGLIGEPPVLLSAGDLIVFPQGDSHVMSSAPGMRGKSELGLYQPVVGRQLPITLNLEGGGSERAQLICGFLGFDSGPFNPLLSTLPRLLHVPKDGLPDTFRAQFIDFALRESTARRPGSECVLARLSELMFIDVVRHYVEVVAPGRTGWLAGLRDDVVGRALAELHDRPAHDWSLEALAREIGVSRSVLAERFAELVGIPPMQYLAQWRMQLTAGLLSGTASLAEIAAQVGYGSETALSRAFKRLVGVAPALWRQGQRKQSVAESTAETAEPISR